MFSLIKPGHILQFDTCPSSIKPPHGIDQSCNNNSLLTLWPNHSKLGDVRCISHPAGYIGRISADIAKMFRTSPNNKSRNLSYSEIGRFFTNSNRIIGSLTCDYVGYVDGQSNYIQSQHTVLSYEFSGCLMAAYITQSGERQIAHVATSSNRAMDCKQAFLDTVRRTGGRLIGWFKPFSRKLDSDRKIDTYNLIRTYLNNNINRLITFGVITQEGKAYSFDAFKPNHVTGNNWVITYVNPKEMNDSWTIQ